MALPKMILFDYGQTLAFETGFDGLRGERAVFRYITENPDSLTPEQIQAFAQELFDGTGRVRDVGFELHEHPLLRFQYEYLGIRLSISIEQAELIFWEAANPIFPMPGTVEMLAFLRERGIRTGVISNLMWSGSALSSRIERLFPEHRFDFILASSECAVRKPDARIFGLALRKAGLRAEDVWFCGDHPVMDVEGAARCGMRGIWYTNRLPCYYRDMTKDPLPDCEYTRIAEWDELVSMLKAEQ